MRCLKATFCMSDVRRRTKRFVETACRKRNVARAHEIATMAASTQGSAPVWPPIKVSNDFLMTAGYPPGDRRETCRDEKRPDEFPASRPNPVVHEPFEEVRAKRHRAEGAASASFRAFRGARRHWADVARCSVFSASGSSRR